MMKPTGERFISGKFDPHAEKEHLDRYKFCLEYVKDKVVLDVACGSGYGSCMLSREAKKVFAVDISEEAIEYARNNLAENNINFIVDDAVSLNSIEDKSIDIVVSFETIEHLENYKGFLATIKRKLKKMDYL